MRHGYKVFATLVVLLAAGPVQAANNALPSDADVTQIIEAWQAGIDHGGWEACEADLAARQARYDAYVGESASLKPLDLILRAETMECHVLLLKDERVSLEHSRKAQLADAAAADAQWSRDHAAAPRTVRDYPGRNRSQIINRRGAAQNLADIKKHDYWIDYNTKEVRRLLLLARAVLTSGELTNGEAQLVRAAADKETGAYDIFKRIMSTIKTPQPSPLPAGPKV